MATDNKIFKMLIAAVVTAFSLIAATNAETRREEKQIAEEHICFKDEVPTHPGAPKRNGRGIDKNPRFIKDRQGKLLIYVSFEKEDCLETYYDTFTEEDCDYLIGLISDKLMNKKNKPFISKDNLKMATLDQKKELIISAHGIDAYYGVESILESFSKKNREIANALFNELRCLADLKFFTKETEEALYDPEKHYKISICETEPKKLTKFLGEDGYSVMSYGDNNDIIKRTLVVIDTYLQDIENLEEAKIFKTDDPEHEEEINILLRNELEKKHLNLLYRQIFLALGLYYPSYSSYGEYKRYPSASSNKDENSVVIEKCFGDDEIKLKSGVHLEKDRNEYLELYQCLDLQTTPTSTDVKTLQQLFGASSDDSLECQIIRKNFKERYALDLRECCLEWEKDENTGIYFADPTLLEMFHVEQEKQGDEL